MDACCAGRCFILWKINARFNPVVLCLPPPVVNHDRWLMVAMSVGDNGKISAISYVGRCYAASSRLIKHLCIRVCQRRNPERNWPFRPVCRCKPWQLNQIHMHNREYVTHLPDVISIIKSGHHHGVAMYMYTVINVACHCCLQWFISIGRLHVDCGFYLATFLSDHLGTNAMEFCHKALVRMEIIAWLLAWKFIILSWQVVAKFCLCRGHLNVSLQQDYSWKLSNQVEQHPAWLPVSVWR